MEAEATQDERKELLPLQNEHRTDNEVTVAPALDVIPSAKDSVTRNHISN